MSGTWSRLQTLVKRPGVGATSAPAASDPATPRQAAYRRVLAPLGQVETVALVVGPDDAQAMFDTLHDELGDASVTLIVMGEDPAEGLELPPWRVRSVATSRDVHRLLAGWGPFDVLVEHGSTSQDEKRRLMRWLLGHVRAGGLYVMDDLASVRAAGPDEGSDLNVVEHACRLALAPGGAESDAVGLNSMDRELARTVASADLSPELLALRRTGEVSIKVRHTELEVILRPRRTPRWSRVLRRIPRTMVVSEAMGHSNDPEQRARRYPAEFGVPKLLLREYDDVVALPAGVLIKDNLILPDSYRLWGGPMQSRTRLEDTSHFFAHTPEVTNAETLHGQYYYLDHEYPRHFGHFMTERLGRLWAWPEAKEANPDLKLLVSQVEPFQTELLGAFGIAAEDIVTFEDGARVESLVSAMPMYHIGRYVSPEILDVYRRLQDGVEQVSGAGHERIFLTRERGLWRECVNAAELEKLFADRGFVVLRPEEYTIPEQAALFREAKVVAGYIGSQLYGQVFSREHLDVIGFVGPSYNSNNEYLLATALGHTLHQFWCPEVQTTREQDVTGRPIIGMHQDYAFDFERDQQALEDLLDRI